MITRDTLRYGLYTAIIVLLLTLTGMFTTFEQRQVVKGGVTLSTVLLVIALGGTGFFTSSKAYNGNPSRALVNGMVGSLIVGLVLAGLILLQANVNLTFVFPGLKPLLASPVTLGQEEVGSGILTLLIVSAALGLAGGWLPVLPRTVRSNLLSSFGLTVVIGLLESQIKSIMTLPDALTLAIAFALAYVVVTRVRLQATLARVIVGFGVGAVVGVALALIAGTGALEPGGILRGVGSVPAVLNQAADTRLISYVAIFGVMGAIGGLVTVASAGIHNGAWLLVTSLVVLGVLNWQNGMTWTAAYLTLFCLLVATAFVTRVGRRVDANYDELRRPEKRSVQWFAFAAGLIVLLVAPLFLGQYITDVLNLVGLYIIMGIGLNVVVGYAGLLDLGYVAFFAIGAYSIGLLTTPSLLTCGGVHPSQITPETLPEICSGVMTFWEAWPVAIALSALAGVLLGIPVLRLRGDYLAIVTLGFGEIIRLIVKFDDFKPLFGAAQGIANIPRPEINLTAINPNWHVKLDGSIGIYYLVLVGIIITAIIATRLATTRLGRAWRAMRADEDVAQAMGIDLVRTKLLAFAIGAAFAGMGGAVAGTRLYGAYPDSYTLLVSINVLSLIIIGGLGSIPGVIVGSLMLIGLPEVLRELEDYRLLAFGVLLVVAMLLKPDGLIPPPVRKLSEMAEERHARERTA